MVKLISITPSTNTKNKYTAKFDIDGKTKTTHFGAKAYNDFTIYSKGDKTIAEKKKEAYIARHKVTENWRDPTGAGTLSRYILWNKPTFEASLADYKKRFNL